MGTDLLYAAITKIAGSAVHGWRETVDWKIFRRLASGSIPAALLSLVVLQSVGKIGKSTEHVILLVLGVMLLITAFATAFQKKLLGRATLARVYVLIDARHGIKDVDQDVLKTLDKSAVSYQVVMTKADQVKPAELEKHIEETTAALAKHPAAFPEVLVTSSKSGTGMPELRAAMVRLLDERS